MGGGIEDNEHDIPLAFKYDISEVGDYIRSELGCCNIGVHFTLGALEAEALGKKLSYSRHCGHYTGRRGISYREAVGAGDYLGGLEDLFEHIVPAPGVRGWQSTVAAKPPLVDRFGHLLRGDSPRLKLLRPAPGVVLRDEANRVLALPNTRAVSRCIKRMAALNEAHAATDVRTAGGVPIAAPMCRMFKRSMAMGGRFFCQGASYQNVPKADRKQSTIDGEPIAEADFKNMHVRIIYYQLGADPPADCYDVGSWPRPLVKRALLILINAENWHKAHGAIAKCEEMAQLELSVAGAQENAARLIEDIKRAHQPIASAFHSGAGLRCQHVESEMAEAVMRSCLDQGVMALSMHDGFIVKNRHAPILIDVMAEIASQNGLGREIVELERD